jgi:hypothetical protein
MRFGNIIKHGKVLRDGGRIERTAGRSSIVTAIKESLHHFVGVQNVLEPSVWQSLVKLNAVMKTRNLSLEK